MEDIIKKTKSSETLDDQFDKLNFILEFKDSFINYMRDNEANVRVGNIKYDLNDIEGSIDSVFNATILEIFHVNELDENGEM